MYKVIDNFLEKDLYHRIANEIKGESIPWYFRKTDVRVKNKNAVTKNKNGYFNFCYYNDYKPDHPLFYPHITPILKTLNCTACIHIRSNLYFRDKDCIESKYHTDFPIDNSTTAIFFLTSCNAKTILKIKNKKVPVNSVENRMLIFKTTIPHKVLYQTDVHKRYIINFNYFENKYV